MEPFPRGGWLVLGFCPPLSCSPSTSKKARFCVIGTAVFRILQNASRDLLNGPYFLRERYRGHPMYGKHGGKIKCHQTRHNKKAQTNMKTHPCCSRHVTKVPFLSRVQTRVFDLCNDISNKISLQPELSLLWASLYLSVSPPVMRCDTKALGN